MRPTNALILACLALAALAPAPARADQPTFSETAAAEAAANATYGPRTTPGQTIPVPDDVSPQLQRLIAAPFGNVADAPKTGDEWKAAVAAANRTAMVNLDRLKRELGVTVEPTVVAGVKAYLVTPMTIPEKNRNRLVVALHGGGYVFYPGEAGTGEGVMMAGFGGFRVLAVDYRMPPDFPFPAALDDAVAVWKEVVKTTKPENVALIGSSAGGGLALATILRLKDEGLPLPGALAAGTPWSDLSSAGDSYAANAWLDNVLVAYGGMLEGMARLYAGGESFRNPYLSPIYGDFSKFPPTILTTGTRDLFLSNTVRAHRALKRAGAVADLEVYEGESHAQFLAGPSVPESREAFADIAAFFDAHLGR
ncbi:acetyl esterase/lipase [Roseiarcus fermentans]|uniref:Acetyl esterase/lipase n=1 Tax=Roseiarcus fermentans TaxID=1473586 RepID=A0A366FHQ0_9HYPH|nr:alpha/beta hydrolase [Roseiarcus fermentans]RBP14131.1 acetyl esterase/lipase [Roseiarcus fermentans]